MMPYRRDKNPFPCGVCGENYEGIRDIACDGCDKWHHLSCEQMKAADFNFLKKSSFSYFCQACLLSGKDTFDWEYSLLRLASATQDSNLNELIKRERIFVNRVTNKLHLQKPLTLTPGVFNKDVFAEGLLGKQWTKSTPVRAKADDILEVDSLPASTKLTDDIVAYDWHINTKYYSNNVKLCVTDVKTISDKEIALAVEAFIIYFDASEASSFEAVKSWIPLLNETDPEIRLLVCNRCTETDVNDSITVQKWCLDNGFELVEFCPEEDSDVEDDFAETFGTKRIIEALQSHSWPNAQIKKNTNTFSPKCLKLVQESACESKPFQSEKEAAAIPLSTGEGDSLKSNKLNFSGNVSSDDNSHLDAKNCGASMKCSDKIVDDGKKQSNNSTEKSHDEVLPVDDILELIKNQESEESFEQLFEKLSLMKEGVKNFFGLGRLISEKSSSLPPDERKQYAEKIAVLFWKAIGGEDEEIEGLDIDL